MPDPLIILASPRSFTSVICAMLGQHPQMYGLPEVNLFVAETMRERQGFLNMKANGGPGLLRAVAQLFGGEQTVQTVALAKRWVQFRMESACVSVMRELAEKVHPRILVEKSPRTVRRLECIYRARKGFPNAKYIHLLRHPRPQAESTLELWGPLAVKLGGLDYSTNPPTLALEKLWFTEQIHICAFLTSVPPENQLRIRGEDLLADPDRYVRQIAEWLGLRTDKEAIEEMKHPERSPYAGFGPMNARLGNDPKFLHDPRLRPYRPKKLPSLEGPLSWRQDGKGFSPELIQLATEFGYT